MSELLTKEARADIRKDWNDGFGIFPASWYERHLLDTLDTCDAIEDGRDGWQRECLTRREQMGYDDETGLDEGHHHCRLCRTTWYNDAGDFCPECGGDEVVELEAALEKYRAPFERCARCRVPRIDHDRASSSHKIVGSGEYVDPDEYGDENYDG